MIPRVRTIALVAAPAGGPYLATETDMGRDALSSVSGTITGDTTLTSVSASDGEYGANALQQVEKLRDSDPTKYRYDPNLAKKLHGQSGAKATGSEPNLVGGKIQDDREVLRFDITPEWVTNRFSRVGTVLADMNLDGLRVPFVTGTTAQDVAGTLTYYFDHSRQLQRVTVHGFTGDPTRVIDAMTRHYGLAHEPSLEAGVFTRRWNGNPVHFMRLSRAPVMYSDAVHQKYTVFLELNQPSLRFGISPEAKKIVESDRSSGRW